MFAELNEQVDDEYADVTEGEYTVDAYIGTTSSFESTAAEDGTISFTSVEVPAIVVDVQLKTETDFDDLVKPEVTINLSGEETALDSNSTLKMNGVVTWTYAYEIDENSNTENVIVTVDGTEYTFSL